MLLLSQREVAGLLLDKNKPPVSMRQVLDKCHEINVNCHIHGGFLRDICAGNDSNDIDLSFESDSQCMERLQALAKEEGWAFSMKTVFRQRHNLPPGGSYFAFGDQSQKQGIEGKLCRDMFSGEIISWPCQDFCCNTLRYDIERDILIDRTGFGLDDALAHLLRPTCGVDDWPAWANESAHASSRKAMRWVKFRARGFNAAEPDGEFMRFIMQQFVRDFSGDREKDEEKQHHPLQSVKHHHILQSMKDHIEEADEGWEKYKECLYEVRSFFVVCPALHISVQT
jgi:hypothetical protein